MVSIVGRMGASLLKIGSPIGPRASSRERGLFRADRTAAARHTWLGESHVPGLTGVGRLPAGYICGKPDTAEAFK